MKIILTSLILLTLGVIFHDCDILYAQLYAEVERLRGWFDKYENDSAILPEDIGFVEYIQSLQQQLAEKDALIEEAKEFFKIQTERHTDPLILCPCFGCEWLRKVEEIK